MESIRLDYNDRKNVLFYVSDSSQPNLVRNMVRCFCKKMFMIKEHSKNDIICPHCSNVINSQNSTYLNFGEYKSFNSSSIMYLNDDNIVISLGMLTLFRENFKHHVNIGSDFFRLKVKFNLTSKTSLAYIGRLRCTDYGWERYKLPTKYLNFTQPKKDTLETSKYDIVLPDGLVEDFCNILGIEVPKITNVTLEDLAWLNRLRKPYEECMRQKYILTLILEKRAQSQFTYQNNKDSLKRVLERNLGPKEDNYDNPFVLPGEDTPEAKIKYIEELNLDIIHSKTEYEYYKKVEGRIKRYLKTDYKPKNYDDNTYEALLKIAKLDRFHIPKDLEKYYYQYPHAIMYANIHEELYKNRDVRINAIKTTKVDYYGFGYIDYAQQEINIRENALEIFKTEVNIQNKLKNNNRYDLLRDTVNMINEIRDLEKDKFEEEKTVIKTKGNIKKVHDNVQQIYAGATLPKIIFDLTKNKNDVIYNQNKKEYTFTYEKTPQDLMRIHYDLNLCVGSYWQYCRDNMIMIVSIKENSKYIGCLELSYYQNILTLVQAKGNGNSILSANIQKIISKFCMDNNYKINTRDIKKLNIMNAA